MKIVFVAMSKKIFYHRFTISRFILNQGDIPMNPFMNFDYYLGESIDREKIKEANNGLVKRCDELWVFGDISDGVQREIEIAEETRKNIRFFSINNKGEINETNKEKVKFET